MALPKTLAVALVLLVVAVGGVCSSYVQSHMNMEHCAGGVTSPWCGSITDHKTLMSNALVSVVSFVLLGLYFFVWSTVVPLFRTRRFDTIESFVRKRLFLLIPDTLQMLFSRGILNPKLYRA